MAVTGQTVTVYRGSAVSITFTTATATGIAGWTIKFTVASALGSGTKAIASVTATHVDEANGEYRVDLTAAQTDIRPADYVFDVWRTDAGSEEYLASGTFTVADVARLPAA